MLTPRNKKRVREAPVYRDRTHLYLEWRGKRSNRVFFAQSFLLFPNLTTLSLSSGRINDEDVRVLCTQHLAANENVHHVNLSGNEITSRGVQFISVHLKNVTYLDITYNRLCFEAIRHIAVLVARNTPLRELRVAEYDNLPDNFEDDDALLFPREHIIALANALASNTHLKRFRFECSCLYNTDYTHRIFHTLAHSNTTLTHLALDNSDMSHKMFRAFLEMMRSNTTLKRIAVNYINVEYARTNELIDAIIKHPTLINISCFFNISDARRGHLTRALSIKQVTLHRKQYTLQQLAFECAMYAHLPINEFICPFIEAPLAEWFFDILKVYR
jgi:Ran GTPase-activating protein (RanGAP) involved in mRNA processing and transport